MVGNLLISFIFHVIAAGPVEVAVAAPAALLKTAAATASKAAPAAETAAEQEVLRKVRLLQAAGKHVEALELVVKALKSETAAERRALLLFSAGDLAARAGRVSEARAHFRQALDAGTRLDDHARFNLGLAQMKLGEAKSARQQFEAVLESKAPQSMQLEARQHIAEIAAHEKSYVEARRHLAYLQKRRKYTDAYPRVLFQLLRVDRGLKNKSSVCRWARELYSRYPSHPLVAEWSMDLPKARVDGQALGCPVAVRDKLDRIKRLQWAGDSARAQAELNQLRTDAPELGAYTFDMLMANHLINEGATDEALKLLIKHYDTHARDVGYMMQLGKAAARAGEYPAAVGAYYKAYKLAPNGRSSKQALFQAAFMSYQFQDYDGATRKFDEFMGRWPKSGLARDSGWHMAWIRYLKQDYQGAYSAFMELQRPTQKKRRGRTIQVAPANIERVQYWAAMSMLKLGRESDAKELLEKLSGDPGLGYYSVVAHYRLQAIGEKNAPKTEIRSVAAAPDGALEIGAAEGQAIADNEEEESEEAIAGEAAGEGGPVPIPEEKLLTARFNDPHLAKRFDRARELAAVGRADLARQELYEIERSTRSVEDRRKLMTEYQAVDNFNRSSYISEVGFGAERRRGGLAGSRQLWEFAYPRAFERSVASSARSFSVPKEFVWAIMRAESQYRQEVQSPVGAMGLMQLMPFTSRRVAELLGLRAFEVQTLLEPETNIHLGTRYLQRLLDKFSGSIPLAAAAYNAGPHRVQSWLKSFGLLDMDEFIEHIPFVETRNYVKKVSRNFQIYNLLYNAQGPKEGRSLNWLVSPVGVRPSESKSDVW